MYAEYQWIQQYHQKPHIKQLFKKVAPSQLAPSQLALNKVMPKYKIIYDAILYQHFAQLFIKVDIYKPC